MRFVVEELFRLLINVKSHVMHMFSRMFVLTLIVGLMMIKQVLSLVKVETT